VYLEIVHWFLFTATVTAIAPGLLRNYLLRLFIKIPMTYCKVISKNEFNYLIYLYHRNHAHMI